jgi:hypothetical protein
MARKRVPFLVRRIGIVPHSLRGANDRSADRSGFKEKVKRLEELTLGVRVIPGA